jgi:hypothetical protein
VKKWFNPKRTIAMNTYSEIDEMGLWARIKRSLAKRWLEQIQAAPGSGVDEEYGGDIDGEFSTVSELLEVSMPVAMADAWPGVVDAPSTPPLMGRVFSKSRSSSGSRPPGGRTASPGSEMDVEEEKSEDEASKKRDKRKKAEKETKASESEEAPTSDNASPGARRVTTDPSHLTSGFLNVPLNLRRSEEHVPE